VGFVVDKVALGQVSPAPQSPSSIIWYDRPVVSAALSGLSLIPLRIIIRIMNNNLRCWYDQEAGLTSFWKVKQRVTTNTSFNP
jgi:hypothetical protein